VWRKKRVVSTEAKSRLLETKAVAKVSRTDDRFRRKQERATADRAPEQPVS